MAEIKNLKISGRTQLCDFFDFYFSDKSGSGTVPGWHNYSLYYYQIFDPLRYREMNVFELGIGTNFPDVESSMGINGKPGASLRAWRDFFPNSLIYGADVDSRVLFQEDRIKTFYCDQTNSQDIISMWGKISTEFDIIIEDGLHKFDANVCFLENSISQLKIGGHFIIEDVQGSELNLWVDKTEQYERDIPNFEFNILSIDLPTNTYDNNIIHIIRKY